MQLEKIRVSSRTTHLLAMLKSATGVSHEAWARVALCLSLRQRGIPNPDEYNLDGSEYTESRLFGGEKLYPALIVGRLLDDGLDPGTYMAEMTRAHINRGAISLKQRVGSLPDLYQFIEEMGVPAPEGGPNA